MSNFHLVFVAKMTPRYELDINCVDSEAYETFGAAHIIQTDLAPTMKTKEPSDVTVIEKLERHPSVKEVVDPIPNFESVEKLLIDLCDKKLHPMYKRYSTQSNEHHLMI